MVLNATKRRYQHLARLIPEVFISVYSEIIHSQLKYCVQLWSRSLGFDLRKIEELQRAAYRLITGLCYLPYQERLNSFYMFFLEHHQVHDDLILIFNMVNELTSPCSYLFCTM